MPSTAGVGDTRVPEWTECVWSSLQSPLKFEINIDFIKQFQGFYSIDMLEGANSTHRHENGPLALFIVAGMGNTQCPLIDSHVHHSHTVG